jgi:hypothetical protein
MISVRYDRNGFRNHDDLETADIVVIGDSYIEGYMTPDSQLVTTLLSQLTGKVVANLGHSGYGPQQELVVLKRYGQPLHPSIVIWAFFEGNDFSDAVRYENQVGGLKHSAWHNLWFRSMTRNVLTRILHPGHKCRPNPDIKEFEATFMGDRSQSTTVFFAPLEIQPQPIAATKFRQALMPISEAAALCQRWNIDFIVAFVPNKYRVYQDLPNVKLTSNSLHVRTISDLPNELGRRLAQLNLGIRYVDLTPALKAASLQGIATYLADDTHWTEAGNRIAAETLYKALYTAPGAKTTSAAGL